MRGCLALGPQFGLGGLGVEGPEIVTSKMYQILAILVEAVGNRDFGIPFTRFHR